MKILVVGASGRMGHELLKIAEEGKEFEAIAISRQPQGNTLRFAKLEEVPEAILQKRPVVIDFTGAEYFTQVISFIGKTKLPLVSGTTGISDSQRQAMTGLAKTSAVLWSANMSIGIQILLKALQSLKGTVGFDFAIEEFHHRHKKDNPGGTALRLHQEMTTKLGLKVPAPIGFRGGGIIGVHKVHAISEQEHLVFEHQAISRAVFAQGALVAAKWIHNKPAGLYSMEEVLS